MKFIKIIFLALLFVLNLKAQELEQNKKNVDSLINLVKNYTSLKNNSAVIMNDKNLEEVKKMLYKSYADAPVEFEKKIHSWVEEWKNSGTPGIKDPKVKNPEFA